MTTKLLIAGIVLMIFINGATEIINGATEIINSAPKMQCAIRMVRLGLTQTPFDYASADIATKRCVSLLAQ